MRIDTYNSVDVELQDGEVARVLSTEHESTDSYNAKWHVLLVVGPPETVDEMAKAMERTLRNAP